MSIAVGSGSSGVGNVYVKGGQTTAGNKDGGHVATVAGTGGQTSAGAHVAIRTPRKSGSLLLWQYHLQDSDCKAIKALVHIRARVLSPAKPNQLRGRGGRLCTPAYPGTHAQPGSHVHGDYDESGDMIDMFAGHTLSDDASVTHSSGGEIVAAGLGSAATGGQIVMMGGYGLKTSSGSVTVKRNAGESGVSGGVIVQLGHDEQRQLWIHRHRHWRIHGARQAPSASVCR